MFTSPKIAVTAVTKHRRQMTQNLTLIRLGQFYNIVFYDDTRKTTPSMSFLSTKSVNVHSAWILNKMPSFVCVCVCVCDCAGQHNSVSCQYDKGIQESNSVCELNVNYMCNIFFIVKVISLWKKLVWILILFLMVHFKQQRYSVIILRISKLL